MTQTVTRSYCSQAQVESAMGVAAAETNVTAADILAAIKFASDEVDDITHSVFLSIEDSGTASATGTTLSLVDTTKSATWTTDKWENYVLWIYGGTGAGQYSRIASNTTTVLTLTDAITVSDNTSKYRIIPDCYISESLDGTNTDRVFLTKLPIRSLISLSVAGTTVTTTKVYVYNNTGMLQLHSQLSPEKTYFDNTYPQDIVLKYVYGVYPIPNSIVRLTACIAAIKCLVEQTGGTYNDVTTFAVPHFSGSTGEPYMNVRETIIRLNEEVADEIRKIPVYYTVV